MNAYIQCMLCYYRHILTRNLWDLTWRLVHWLKLFFLSLHILIDSTVKCYYTHDFPINISIYHLFIQLIHHQYVQYVDMYLCWKALNLCNNDNEGGERDFLSYFLRWLLAIGCVSYGVRGNYIKVQIFCFDDFWFILTILMDLWKVWCELLWSFEWFLCWESIETLLALFPRDWATLNRTEQNWTELSKT